ncbi:exostosin-like protein [Tanacetum coccineum]
MASATKLTISITLLAFLLLIVYLSPVNQTSNLFPMVSNSPSTSASRFLQHEDAPEIKKYDIRLRRIEEQLTKARARIQQASVNNSSAFTQKSEGFIPEGATYRNSAAFFQSHTEMIKTFKIWTYKEGEIPLAHIGPMKSIYSSEGLFIDEMEKKGYFVAANHPDEAHAFLIPLSVAEIVHYLFSPSEIITFRERIQDIFEDYIGVIAKKYPYWNRSNGADHFYVSCHDWGPHASQRNTKLFKNVIRVLCNANTSEGFVPNRDVSMMEINAPYNGIPIVSGGQSPYNRSILAFFAGGNHGYVRKKLFESWGNKEDKDIQVYDYLPKGMNYTELLTQSKYCLCPSGYEVASARATEAIYVGCIPVIIKSNYVLPYSDVLDWSQFSVQLPVDKIPDLKRILQDIPFSKYLEMQKQVMET